MSRDIDAPNHIHPIGTRVTFVNDYGLSFPGLTVTGTKVCPTFGRVYDVEPTDTPWFPKRANNLFVEYGQ